MPAVDSPSVTVVVPVKDRRERMLRCLDALLALEYPNYDVLVLDNGSSDGTAEACREHARDADVPVRVEVIDGTVGKLRNRAAELSDSDLLAFTDSDCMPAPGWLAAGTWPFRDRPRVGVVQGTTLPEPGVEFEGWAATIEVTEWSGLYESCNLIVRREALAAADGFDEQVGHFWEDTAAGMSLMRDGWEAAFVPDALVHHDVTHPGFAWQLKRGQRYGNAAAVARKYPEIRRELFWGRIFLRSRNAKMVAAVAGVALAPFDRRALLLTVPYVWYRAPKPGEPWGLKGAVQATLFDLSIMIGLMRGSVRYRALVL